MTLAMGVLCDSGAVLLTDSMRVIPQWDGTVTGIIQADGRKILYAPRFAAVHSGGAPVEWPPLPELAPDIETASRQLFEFVSAGQWVESVPSAQRDPNHHLIVAGGSPGQSVGMVLHRGDASPEWASPDYPVLVAGAPADGWWSEQPSRGLYRPTTLADCFGIAVRIAGKFIAEHYAQADCNTLTDFASKGLVPCAAYPLHVVYVDPFGIHLAKIEDSHAAVA